MVRKIKAKLVLQLRNQSLSRRAIESAHKISRHSIPAVLDAAELAGLGWDDVAEMTSPRCRRPRYIRRCFPAAG